MTNLLWDFQENGYLIVKDFISKNCISDIRDESEKLLFEENSSTLMPTSLLKSTLLSNIIFSSSFIQILNKLSVKYFHFLPNFTIRKDLYVGWHSDDAFVDADTAELPGVLQCNIYLQDNCPNHGGGIDIAPGTHRFTQQKKELLVKAESFEYTTTPLSAGDLLIFDYRVLHRSTMPLIKPRPGSRLALQWTVCKSHEHAEKFISYFIRRQQEKLHLSDFTNNRALAYLNDLQNVHFPYTFLDSTQNNIIRTGVKIYEIKITNEELP
ncbi:MAG: phytanoyl-CoA dioxygenase family protein [Legionella sp.]|nr:phytanoyl-CoA dioxygenase family protein [Legionella sp.]